MESPSVIFPYRGESCISKQKVAGCKFLWTGKVPDSLEYIFGYFWGDFRKCLGEKHFCVERSLSESVSLSVWCPVNPVCASRHDSLPGCW